jgi:DNA-binding MarR family transcriptional regulator
MEDYKQYTVLKLMMTLPLILKKVFRGGEPPLHEKYKLNRTHLKTLFLISHLQNPNMTIICNHINKAKGSLTSVVNTLIQEKLVERRRDPKDRRQLNLYLTEEGRKITETYSEWINSQINEKLSRLSEEEQAEFHSALLKLYEIALKL